MKKYGILLLIVLFGFSACKQTNRIKQQKANLIEKPNLKLSSDIMTPEVLWSFGRLSDIQLSPDGKTLVYGVTYYSKKQNKGNRELYSIGVDGKNLKQLTHTPGSEYNALWRPDGKKIGFLSARNGSMQLWEINPDGSDPIQISHFKGGITGFKYAPDGKKILFTAEVKIDKTPRDIYPDLPKTTGRIYTDLMYRHWDTWVDSYSHIFVASYDGSSLKKIVLNWLYSSTISWPRQDFKAGLKGTHWT